MFHNEERVGAGQVIGLRIALVALLCGSGQAQNEAFRPLFDGKSLTGWKAYTNEGVEVGRDQSAFSVKDGMLYCSGRGPDYWVTAPGKFSDCVLRLEFKATDRANSGVFFRVPGPARPAFTGFEVQVLGDYGDDPSSHSCGSIYDVLTPMRAMGKPSGEWNQYEITVKGSLVTVVLNGFKVIDTDFSLLTEPVGKYDFPYSKMPREGMIGLQNHGGELWYRNIEVKEIK